MSQNAYPWNVLGIDETDDKKSIKKAYAVLIKKFKPDENPENFQEIQEAYRFALSTLELQYNLKSLNEENFELLDNTTELNLNSSIEGNNKLSSDQQNIVDNLLNNIKSMTFDRTKKKNNKAHWSFIEDFHKIEDFQTKNHVSQLIFKNVAENNLFLMQLYDQLLIKPQILKYMNEVFDWSSKWQEYSIIFPGNYFAVTLDFIEDKERLLYKMYKVNESLDNLSMKIDNTSRALLSIIEKPIKRLYSFIIDALIALIIIMLLKSTYLYTTHFGLTYFFIFMFARIVSEASTSSNTSIGKTLIRLSIVYKSENEKTLNQILLRNLIISLSIYPTWMLRTNNDLIYNILIIIALLNLYTLVSKQCLFHDLITKSRIIIRT